MPLKQGAGLETSWGHSNASKTLPRAVARGRARHRKEALRALTLGAARRRDRAGKSDPSVARLPGLSAVMEEVEAEEQEEFSNRQV